LAPLKVNRDAGMRQSGCRGPGPQGKRDVSQIDVRWAYIRTNAYDIGERHRGAASSVRRRREVQG
jgi:hypothetical protein